MDILRKTIIATLPLLLTGCYEDFNPRIDTTPVICINSLITAGEPIEVSVSRTWVFTDEEGEKDHSVKDASVSIFANGERVSHDYLPEEGDVIRIEAYSAIYGHAEAEVTVPYATPVEAVKLTPALKKCGVRDLNEYGVSVDIEFNAAIALTLPNYHDSDHYYYLTQDYFLPESTPYDAEDIYGETGWQTIHSMVHFYGGRFYWNDPIFSEHISSFDEAMDYAWIEDPLFFSDRQFSGASETLHLGYENGNIHINQWDMNPDMLDCGYTMTLYSISESYYKWLNYRWQRDESIMGDFIEIGFAEPVWGYSNVSTGAGVVAARSSVSVRISLSDFLKECITESLP